MALRKAGKILLYSCAGTLGIFLLLMLAVKLALDRAPQYQAEIKEWVHGRIGYTIAFAHVSPAFRWYGPELYFDRLELRSKDGRRVLARAAGGRIGADLWQLVKSGKLFAGRVELDSPDISVTRRGPDAFALASEIELGGGDSSYQTHTLDDFPAGTLAIRHGRLTVQDWNAALPQLELRDVKLDLRRGNGVATLAVAANLPAVLGGGVSVNGTASGFGVLNTLNWTLRWRTRNLSLSGWRQLLPQYLTRLNSGTGGFEVTARGRGAELARADLDCLASGVTTQLGLEPAVKFEQVSGAFSVTHSGDRWTLEGRRVRALRDGHRDPESEFEASWREGEGGLVELRARASYLRADTLLPLAGLLPQRDLRERLQEVAPTGEWIDTHVELMRGAVSDPWRFAVGAHFRGVGFAPAGHAPGLRGLSGALDGTESGGRVTIDTHTGVVTWPQQFEQAIDLENFKTAIYWKRTADELVVATPSIELKTRDAALHGPVAWRQPADGGSPVLTLAVSVEDGNAAQAHLYFPRAQLHPHVLAWLDRAFVGGHLPHADVVFQGPVRHFPFRDGTGLFLARVRIDGMTLDYREGWPRAENLAVSAEFRNEGLTARLLGGNIGNLAVQKGDLRFVDFKTGEMQLHVAGSGDAADALDYLRATPLDAAAAHAFSAVDAAGPVRAEVDLFLPFKAFDERRVLVHTHLQGVSVNRRLTADNAAATANAAARNNTAIMSAMAAVAATELYGDADIDGGHVAHADVQGKLLGGPFEMQARSPHNRPLARTVLVFNGVLAGDALHAALGLPANIAIGGTTDWHGVLRVASEPVRERSLRINGSLAGLDLNLPEPLAKPAGRALPSSLEIQWPAAGGPQLRVTLGSVLRGQINLDSGANGPTLGRAAVTFGGGAEPALSDTQLLSTGGKIERLDLEGWLKLYTPDKSARPPANFLRSAQFEVAQIDYLGLSFRDVAVNLAATDTGFKIGIGGPNVVGSVVLPNAAEAAEPWKMEFKRLKFLAQSDAGVTNPSGSGAASRGGASPGIANPRRIPAIEFHSEETIWDERQLGEVRARLEKLEDGIGLKLLTATGATFTVNADGAWRGKEAGLGHLEGTLTSTDVGGTLKQLGYAAVIEAKAGKMDFDMNWVGAPTADALKDATGHIQVALDKGQITGLKPGAGRVVGLASVAALPRRLALDFSDLTDKGFAFDSVRGDFDLREGSAFTDDVLVKGPAAEIGLIGRVGLKNKDYDQTAVVTGNVSNSLPLAALAAGPVVGGAVLIFTQVFKQPLKGLARGYYRITGNWDNPTVERIKSADAAATAEAPK
ncbi:MAG TPA: YhdP family protein [Steroidobacteraceae bacterium]|nr:YhdP family protein [Steroidobacteraceae bacterium]